mmetsp:Transcript_31067/g.66833  ORF Transcript_31067/g.66833 Transcript_31067/m.66833 type:complete len:294 (+) Transcript_31067:1134-2015(+)
MFCISTRNKELTFLFLSRLSMSQSGLYLEAPREISPGQGHFQPEVCEGRVLQVVGEGREVDALETLEVLQRRDAGQEKGLERARQRPVPPLGLVQVPFCPRRHLEDHFRQLIRIVPLLNLAVIELVLAAEVRRKVHFILARVLGDVAEQRREPNPFPHVPRRIQGLRLCDLARLQHQVVQRGVHLLSMLLERLQRAHHFDRLLRHVNLRLDHARQKVLARARVPHHVRQRRHYWMVWNLLRIADFVDGVGPPPELQGGELRLGARLQNLVELAVQRVRDKRVGAVLRPQQRGA